MRLSGVPVFKKFVVDGLVAAQEAFDVIDNVPAVDPNKMGIKINRQKMKGHYEFKNVNFSYPSNGLQVLKNFTCTFEAGQTTAFVGPSGSGKSTIIQLVERFYNPDNGSITLDGVPIEKYDLRDMRRTIGYVG